MRNQHRHNFFDPFGKPFLLIQLLCVLYEFMLIKQLVSDVKLSCE